MDRLICSSNKDLKPSLLSSRLHYEAVIFQACIGKDVRQPPCSLKQIVTRCAPQNRMTYNMTPALQTSAFLPSYVRLLEMTSGAAHAQHKPLKHFLHSATDKVQYAKAEEGMFITMMTIRNEELKKRQAWFPAGHS